MRKVELVLNTEKEKVLKCEEYKITLRKDNGAILTHIEKEGYGNISHIYLSYKTHNNQETIKIKNLYEIRSIIRNCHNQYSFMLEQEPIFSDKVSYGFDLKCLLVYKDFYESSDIIEKQNNYMTLEKEKCEKLFSLLTHEIVIDLFEKALKGEEPWV